MQLSEDILDVTRIESGSFFLKKEKFDKEMITEILRDFELKIVENKKNIKLYYEFYDNNNDELIIEADRNRLSQVVYNLLNNVFNFTSEGITIIVDERKKDNINNDEILVSIKDTGTGIHPEILPKLFTKFASSNLLL